MVVTYQTYTHTRAQMSWPILFCTDIYKSLNKPAKSYKNRMYSTNIYIYVGVLKWIRLVKVPVKKKNEKLMFA